MSFFIAYGVRLLVRFCWHAWLGVGTPRAAAARGDRLESRGLPEEAQEALRQSCSVGRAQHGKIEGSVKDDFEVQPPDFDACSIIKRARQRVPRTPPRRVQDALKGLDRSRRFLFSMSAWSGSITSEA